MSILKIDEQSLTDGLIDCHLVSGLFYCCSLLREVNWNATSRNLELMQCHVSDKKKKSWGSKDRKSTVSYRTV